MRLKTPSSLEVTSISSISGLAFAHENETLNSFEREEGISWSDSLGMTAMPSSISTMKKVLMENADNFISR